MTSPALGIAYVFWLRLRWVFAAACILVPAFAVAVRWFPATAPYCQFASMILFFSAMLPLLNACTLGPSDLGARASGFPSHMFVLPLSNRSLVGWPMLYGSFIFGGLWFLVASLIFIPTNLPLPVDWPAMMLVAICVWMQALGWSPFSSPYVRVPALAIAVAPLILFPLWSRIGMPPHDGMVPLLLAWSMAWSLVAFLFGVRGLGRARSGEAIVWYQPFVDRVGVRYSVRHATSQRRRPFHSPAAAQFWHECRRNALVMPAMLSFMGVPFLLVMCQAVIRSRDHSGIAVGSFTIPPSLLPLAICIGLPILLSVVGGSGLAKFDIWGTEQMPSFFAIRPMATSQFIRIKLAAVALSALTAWAIMIAMVVLWAFVEAGPLNSRESILRAAWTQATPQSLAVLFAVVIGSAALMWRNLLVGMWTSLIGRKWVSVVLAIPSVALIGAAVLAGVWIYNHPEFQRLLPAILRWVILGLLAEKFLGAIAVSLAVTRWDITRAKHLAVLFAGWLLLVCLLFAVLYCFTSPTWMLVAGIVLLVPFSRVAIFPLALHWNRHR